MKILQVISSLQRGGAERLAINLSHELIKLGHTVLLVQLRPEVDYPELQEGLDIRVAPSRVYHSVFGKSTVEIEAFERIVTEFKPDLIHSHLLDAEFVSRFHTYPDITYITHWHGCPSLTEPIPFSDWFTKETIWKWNTKRILRSQYRKCSNHFLCISDFIGKYVQERLGVEESDLTVIHNAIDLTLFKPMGLPKKEGFRLINIGSLHKNKNHQFLLKLMKRLLEMGHTDIFLDIYSDGPERGFLEQEIVRNGLQTHVVLHGVISDPEVQLNKAHVLTQCAWHEPFGLIIVEAMACGIPAMSFDTGGPSELILDGETGYLIQKDDLDMYISKILELYDDRKKTEQLGKNAIEHARQFGLDEYGKKVEALYERCLARPKV